MRLAIGVLIGAFLSWLMSADHYGRIGRGDTTAGIMCRVHGMDTVRVGAFLEAPEYVCIDLRYATPERDLWDHFYAEFNDLWSRPR